MTEGDEESELIREMNAELHSDTKFQAVERLVSELWDLYDEARDQPSEIQRLRRWMCKARSYRTKPYTSFRMKLPTAN